MEQNFVNKTDEIENTIVEFKPDLFLISEAYYFNNIPEYKMNIPGYTLIHSPTYKKHGYDRLTGTG